MRSSLRFVFISTITLLTACGGGGSSTSQSLVPNAAENTESTQPESDNQVTQPTTSAIENNPPPTAVVEPEPAPVSEPQPEPPVVEQQPTPDTIISEAIILRIEEDSEKTLIYSESTSNIEGTLSNYSALEGLLKIENEGLVYTPPTNFHGEDEISYVLSTRQGELEQRIIVEVLAVNDAPEILVQPLSTSEDTPLLGITPEQLANDVDGDELSIVRVSSAQGRAEVNQDGALVYTPPPDFHGKTSVDVVISDGESEATGVIEIDISPINDTPEISTLSVTVAEDSSTNQVFVSQIAADPDGDPVTLSSAAAINGSVEIIQGTSFTYTPESNFNGQDQVSLTLTDGSEILQTSVAIQVTPVNDVPVANEYQFTIDEDQTGVIIQPSNSASDIDGDVLSLQNLEFDIGSASIIDARSASYTPPANFSGIVTGTYTITDGQAADTGFITLTINEINDAPTAANDAASVEENSQNNLIDVTLNDSDPENQSITLLSANATLGAVQIVNGVLSYTPDNDFWGEDIVTYTVEDEEGATATADLTITVTEITERTVHLSWTAPTERENGEQLLAEDIQGYEVLYTNEDSAAETQRWIAGGSTLEESITLTEEGRYTFRIATVDSDGLYSEFSDSVEIDVYF